MWLLRLMLAAAAWLLAARYLRAWRLARPELHPSQSRFDVRERQRRACVGLRDRGARLCCGAGCLTGALGEGADALPRADPQRAALCQGDGLLLDGRFLRAPGLREVERALGG